MTVTEADLRYAAWDAGFSAGFDAAKDMVREWAQEQMELRNESGSYARGQRYILRLVTELVEPE